MNERRLPPVAEDALDVQRKAVGNGGDGLPKDQATAVLVADDQFTEGDAAYALELMESVWIRSKTWPAALFWRRQSSD